MKAFAGIYNVAFRVRPVPGALVISHCAAPWGTGPRCVVRPRGRDLHKELGWKLFFRNLSVRRLPHGLGQTISILLRRSSHFQCSAVHPWWHIGRCSKSLLLRRVLWSVWSHPRFLRAGRCHEAARRQSSWSRATGWIYWSGTLQGLSCPLPLRDVVFACGEELCFVPHLTRIPGLNSWLGTPSMVTSTFVILGL